MIMIKSERMWENAKDTVVNEKGKNKGSKRETREVSFRSALSLR